MEKYDLEGIEEKLYLAVEPEKHGEIGIMIPERMDLGEMLYVLGVRASMKKDKKFQRVCIPGGKFAVFTTPPVDMTLSDDLFAKMIQRTWLHIFDEWFLTSDYRYDESRYDFEYYDERCHYLTNSVMEIYIPIYE